MMYYVDKKKAEIHQKNQDFNPAIIELLEDARIRYKKAKLYENCIIYFANLIIFYSILQIK